MVTMVTVFLGYPTPIIELCQYHRHHRHHRHHRSSKGEPCFSMGFISDVFRFKYFIEILRHVVGELVRFSIFNTCRCKQLGGRSLPVSHTFDVLRYFPQVVRNSLDFSFLCGFFIFQSPDAIFSRKCSVLSSISRPVSKMSAVWLIRLRCMTQLVSATPISPVEPEICSNGSDAVCLRKW